MKRLLAHRADGRPLFDVEIRKRRTSKERLLFDGSDGHSGQADVDELPALIKSICADFRKRAALKPHRAQIIGALACLRGNCVHTGINDQVGYPSTVNGVLVRIVLVDLDRDVSIRVTRVDIAARHELGVVIDRRVLVHEGVDFALVGRRIRRSRRVLRDVGAGRSVGKIMSQARLGSASSCVR